MELIATCIGGIVGGIVAILIVGFTWSSIVTAFVGGIVGLVAALMCIFLYHLAHGPKVLDEKQLSEIKELQTYKDALERQVDIQANNHTQDVQRLTKKNDGMWDMVRGVQAEIDTLERKRSAFEAERDSLKAQLDQLNNYKLKFDIDTKQTRVKVDESVTGCCIFAGIRMRFDNSSPYPLTIKHLELTLQERNDAGEVREIESVLLNNHVFHPDDNLGPLTRKRFERLSLDAWTLSDDYWFKAELAIHAVKQTELTQGKHFLRMTMLAMNQPPLAIDMYVDWSQATFGRFTPVSLSNLRQSGT